MSPVLLVVTRAELGGAQRVVLELAIKLQQDGHHVTIGSGESGWLLEEAEKRSIATHRFRYLGRDAHPFLSIPFMAELFAYLRACPERPVVHLNSSNALAGSLAAKLAGSRVVFTVHGLSVLDRAYEANPILKALYWAWFRLWFFFVDRVVAVSSKNAEQLSRLHLGEATVVPNGIDGGSLAFLDRAAARAELGIPDAVPVVMTIGRLEYAKRQDLLIRAFAGVLARLPDARLVLVSDGPERGTLESLTRELGITAAVVFTGARPDGYQLMHAADVFALPSRYEGWPIVLLEALAAGLPIVASDVGGIREQIGEAGVLLPQSAFPDAWAGALTALLTEDVRKRELAGIARARSQQWDAAGMAEMYEELYRG